MPDELDVRPDRTDVVIVYVSAVQDQAVKGNEEDPTAWDEQGGAGVVFLIGMAMRMREYAVHADYAHIHKYVDGDAAENLIHINSI